MTARSDPPNASAGACRVAAPGSLRAAEAQAFLVVAQREQATEIDLAPLRDFDSAAIAVLLAIRRRGAGSGQRVRCVNPPPNLRKLAALYDVDGLLFDA